MKKIILSLLLLCVAGCVTIYNPATKKRETYFIDERTEISIGRNLTAQVLKDERVVRNKGMFTSVQKLGEIIARVSDRPTLNYHFYVLDNKDLNAFALPGGYIFVNKGLVERASRDELAFVLGHEIGHVSARHSVKRMQVALGVNFIMDLALHNPKYQNVRRALNMAHDVVSLGYSREDEFLADSLGVTYAARAGFEPSAGITMIEKLKSEHTHVPIVFFSSHPPPDERIKNIRRKIENLSL
jgi:predicted Zn-dependent protease